jgi:Fe-S-cluster-containing dehydrogenase component
MYKDEDGVVRRSAVRCTGCRSCALACPFGVLDEEVTRGQIAKCDLCVDRTEREDSPLLPRCVSVCPSGALQFMDLAEEVEEEGYVVLSGRVISSSG